jgi:hypothetical protein
VLLKVIEDFVDEGIRKKYGLFSEEDIRDFLLKNNNK